MGQSFGAKNFSNKISRPLVILGASARAAAMSARRAGFTPWSGDLFGDLDLRALGPAVRVADYPNDLATVAGDAPAGPWLYTGALENYPALVDQISATRTLYGNPGRTLRAVRDPIRVVQVVQEAGLSMPRCRRSSIDLPRDGSWLRKPLASAGGSRIEIWDARARPSASDDGSYFQQRIEGIPVSAVYVGFGRESQLLGVTRQLIGEPWTGAVRPADRFRYCGSIGPLRLSEVVQERFQQLGKLLVQAFGLIGLFGVDAVLSSPTMLDATAADVWPVEVNPRYTASVEVLEWMTGVEAMRLHAAACEGEFGIRRSEVGSRKSEVGIGGCGGKAIVFAPHDVIVSDAFVQWAHQQNAGHPWPTVADIPSAGTPIRAGQPIATVLCTAPDELSVLSGLQSLIAHVT